MMAMMMQHGMGTGPVMPLLGGGPRDLSPEDVREILEGLIAWHGNDRLQVGDVTEQDEATVVAVIETVDGSLVQRIAVDRDTGRMSPAGQQQ
jgi:hypothetical protein